MTIYGNHKIHVRGFNGFRILEKSGNTIILKRIRQLLQAIERDPYQGIGKPEPLKYGLSGSWSRRINHEHRIIYSLEENIITVYSLRYHYKK